MKFIFIDETEKFDHFGISLVIVDSSKYPYIKKSIINSLNKHKWSVVEEFKSTCIFSATNGDTSVNIETRKRIAEEIISSNISSKNAKLTAYFAYKTGKYTAENYSELLEFLLKKIGKSQSSRNGKNLVSVFFDEIPNKNTVELLFDKIKHLHKKDYLIVEHPSTINSSNNTPGILLADHVAFACMWKCLNESERNKEINEIKKQKNEYIKKLVSTIKNIKIFEVK